MASNVQKADLKKLQEMKDLLDRVAGIMGGLSNPQQREMAVFRFLLDQSQEKLDDHVTSAYVHVHNKLPEQG